jgi:adenosylmethionine-8-amino-7-oxononanoate aminotransferase
MNEQEILDLDRQHVWHPYSGMHADNPLFAVRSAQGVRLRLVDGRELIDGMSSWWCVIHGYNHPGLNGAIMAQLKDMAHVMFGGLTHEPAVTLANKLAELTPEGLDSVFFADSGSVSVEVALKMAIQYWQARGRPHKQRMLTLRRGYHGDTLGAMSVCDPDTGMHNLFSRMLTQQYFVDPPACAFDEPCLPEHIDPVRATLQSHHEQIAAFIVEPIVQGAGGMRFYSPDYLRQLRALCDEFDVLLIADEIATGFGRSGRLFACEYADISPDIMCVGKALTAGYMTMAAVVTTSRIARAISDHPPGVFMHGPTFMANPLACAVANASIDLLLASDWQGRVGNIQGWLQQGLAPCRELQQVADVRVLGAIGVVELKQPVDMRQIQPRFVDKGVWVRPFGRLVYLMPPFVCSEQDVARLTQAVYEVVGEIETPG